ncbi:hypothetical protein [Peptoniphilus catoniae]|uniref:hypothetical protein n=1 Tax=Peptoniphilus catoniae TaxID=1660341 RepID=UPI0010FDCEDA|nr:hypothetical protein [Peptoniphilus catoniae]
MSKKEFIRKIASRKFWACISTVVIAIIAFINADPETTERIVALISAIGGLCIYMLAEGMADSKPTDITNIIDTKEFKDE